MVSILHKIKLAIWLARFAYIIFFCWLILDFFIRDNDARVPGLLFFLIGFPLVYLEDQLDKLDPKYVDTVGHTVWKYLLFPWFLFM